MVADRTDATSAAVDRTASSHANLVRMNCGKLFDRHSANVRSNPTFPTTLAMVALAQSDRAPGCELGGCGFESRTSPQFVTTRDCTCVRSLAERRHPASTRKNAGSIPAGRTMGSYAEIAQQAEQLFRKQHVVGSSPTLGSIVYSHS
jgi:hypothetical protein